MTPLRTLAGFAPAILVTLLAASAQVEAEVTGHAGKPVAPTWAPCVGSANLDCTTIAVPMDHKNLSDQRSFLISVNRLRAETPDEGGSRGTVFLNPGGPGSSGTGLLAKASSFLSMFVGGKYDLIGFDPRGVNETEPAMRCFPSLLDHFVQNTAQGPQTTNLNLPANLSLLPDDPLPAFTQTIKEQSAAWRALFEACEERVGDHRRFVGTWNVVKDIEWMAEAIGGENATVNYMGWSYGTILGQYLVAVLPPHRIGKVQIDGVVDVDRWVKTVDHALEQGIQAAGATLDQFAKLCADAGPQHCALAAANSSFESVNSAIHGLIDDFYLDPKVVPGAAGSSLAGPPEGIVTSSLLRGFIFGGSSLYKPSQWSAAAAVLAEALSGNYTSLGMELSGILGNAVSFAEAARMNDTDQTGPSSLAVIAADAHPYDEKHPRPHSAEIARRVLHLLRSDFPLAGDDVLQWTYSVWPGKPFANHFSGPFDLKNGTLKTPVLILSNVYDPATPLRNARTALRNLGSNARLVYQSDGLGHTTLNDVGRALYDIIREYWIESKIPRAPETSVKAEINPFISPSNLGRRDEADAFLDEWRQRGVRGLVGLSSGR